MKAKTTEIRIETREKILFRRTSPHEIETVCNSCEAASVFMLPERAAYLFDVTAREIYRRVEEGAIHFMETRAGLTLVCTASLSGKPIEIQQLD